MPSILSSVVITTNFDSRGPVTSAYLRNWIAYIDGVCFGYFASKKDAEKACQLACK